MDKFPVGNAVNAGKPWQALPIRLSPEVLRELLDGGQSFRWNIDAHAVWSGQWEHHAIRLRIDDAGQLQWQGRTPATTVHDVEKYLAIDTDFAALTDQLPWRSDPVLADAIAPFPGLRILRQTIEEALIGFICSSSKRIVQIKAAVALVAERFGDEVAPGLHALPRWERLAAVEESELRACKLGYRAGYIARTARFLADEPGWLQRVHALPYAEASAALMQLPGVGAKVADCVLLFGGQRLEAFPVDTWILQAMSRWYQLDGWNPRQIAHFGRIHFGNTAGLAQQYLFAAARQQSNR